MATQWGKTTLFDAAADGDLDAIAARLKNLGAKVDPVDAQGRTPLMEAARYGHVAAVQLLVKNGAGVKATAAGGECALHLAAQNGHDEVVRYLIEEQKVDPDVLDNHGDSPLHYASGAGKLSTIRLLLSLGADKVRKNKNHMTPADAACDAATTELFKEGFIVSPTKY